MGYVRKRQGRRKKQKPQRFPLRELLQKRGVSQLEVMRRTGIGQNRIQAIYSGRQIPTWTTILRICTALDVDLGELVQGGAA